MVGNLTFILYLCGEIGRYGIRGITVQNGAFSPLGDSGE